ncbi:MAG: hypothetical protein QNJ73_12785 [Gammaproteobacteria bacterium]|nr:hypothetical protein [Gammaproteobacteria bacterium]
MARLLLALFTGLVLLTPAAVMAQEEEKQQQETRRTQAMSEKVYRKLAEAQELTDAEDYAGARKILDELAASPKLTPYEKAQLYNFFGFIYYAQERYADSIRAYETVLAQPEIPQGLADQTKYTLAQLHFTMENWQKAIDLINDWMSTAQNPGPDPFILLASAYYSMDQFDRMIQPIERAMQIARDRDQPVKEQWWLLLRVAYFEQDNYQKVRDILEILVVNWPKKEYWTQLSAMYGELDQERKQLSAYASAYDQGMLTRSAELVQLAQLYLQAEAPYKAAKIMEKGIEEGLIDKKADNYRILSQAWMLAAEDRKAIPALKTAASMSDDGDLDARLANSYLNLSEYDQCIEAARSGIRKGGLRREDNAQVVLGMCLFENDQYEAAKKAFRAAAKDKRSQKTAKQWITFIEREQERLRQLERSLQQVRTRQVPG